MADLETAEKNEENLNNREQAPEMNLNEALDYLSKINAENPMTDYTSLDNSINILRNGAEGDRKEAFDVLIGIVNQERANLPKEVAQTVISQEEADATLAKLEMVENVLSRERGKEQMQEGTANPTELKNMKAQHEKDWPKKAAAAREDANNHAIPADEYKNPGKGNGAKGESAEQESSFDIPNRAEFNETASKLGKLFGMEMSEILQIDGKVYDYDTLFQMNQQNKMGHQLADLHKVHEKYLANGNGSTDMLYKFKEDSKDEIYGKQGESNPNEIASRLPDTAKAA
jgi:hypothetical protein